MGLGGAALPTCWSNYTRGVCENLEDYRAATLLTAIDYSKAFNRMSYQQCLSSLAGLGASMDIIRIVASFLTDCHMTVHVGKSWSEPRPVNGGYPQGSIHGVFLLNATINDLEDQYLTRDGRLADTPDLSTSGSEDEIPAGVSTPIQRADDEGDPSTPPPFRFLSELREATRRLRYHSSDDELVPDEPNLPTQAKWKTTQIDLMKYVDDNISSEKLNMDTAEKETITTLITETSRPYKPRTFLGPWLGRRSTKE